MPEIFADPTPAELSRLRSGIRIMALHELRDPDLAEEIAQDTLVRLVLALREGRLQDPAHLGAFTRAIARHVIVDTLRARQRLTATGTTAEPASDEDSLGALVSAEQTTRVRAALEHLSAGDREVLRLSFFEGLTPQQLAERVGEPSPRVRKRKERALERLRRVFLEHGSRDGCPPDSANGGPAGDFPSGDTRMRPGPACEGFADRAFVERYLRQRLSPAEQEAFEAHFLTCEWCQQSIELGRAIRVALPRVEAMPARRSWVALGAGLGLAAAAGVAAVLLLPSTGPPTELTRLGAVVQAPLYLGVPVRADQPLAADSLFGIAMAAYAAERYGEARRALRAALRVGVDSAPAEFFLAASVLMSGDAEDAATGFGRVIALGDTPYRPEAHFYRAKALLRLGRTADALADLRSAAALPGVIGSHAQALADSVQRVAR